MPARLIRLTVALLLICLTPLAAGGSDTDLFSVSVPPNVMLVVDNSGSMNNVVWHEQFDPTVDPTCTHYDNDTTYSFNAVLTFTVCSNTRTLYPDPGIGGWTRITGRYLNWIFSDESDAYQTDLASTNNGTRSACLIAEGLASTYSKYRRSRISAAKEVLREVICKVNEAGAVRFGLAQFYDDSDPEGGYVVVPIDDYDAAHGVLIDSFIEDLAGEAWTPLSETLFNVYRYFMSRTNPIDGKDGTTAFPAYDIETDGDVDFTNAPGSPVEYPCQKNFVVIITDGEPTKDDFDDMDLAVFRDNLIGDFNTDNAAPEPSGNEVDDTCTFCNESSFYLDDIAKFMHETDFDTDIAEDQTIDVYTVGFTTGGPANQLLQKTADVGNGQFYQSNNAEDLTDAIVKALTDIINKTQAFTSATVPASRTTDGDNFYASFFLPKSDSPFWEGHLKNFGFSPTGDIVTPPDGGGVERCATGIDTTATPPCGSGVLRSFETAYWDIASAVPDPANRKLFVEFGATPILNQPPRLEFASTTNPEIVVGGSNVAAESAFNFAAGVDDLDEPYASLPSNTPEDMVVALQEALRGCEFGSSPCVQRTNDAGDKVYMGDIFHSNPVVVGPPNSAFIEEVSYGTVVASNKSPTRTRDRVIVRGCERRLPARLQRRRLAVRRSRTASAAPQTLNPPRHDRGTGRGSSSASCPGRSAPRSRTCRSSSPSRAASRRSTVRPSWPTPGTTGTW